MRDGCVQVCYRPAMPSNVRDHLRIHATPVGGEDPWGQPLISTGDGRAVPAWLWVEYTDPSGRFVADVKIVSEPGRTPPGRAVEVRARALGDHELTGRRLALPLADIVTEGRALLVGDLPEGFRDLPEGEPAPLLVWQAGPEGAERARTEQRAQHHGRLRLAQAADVYVRALEAGEPPAAAVADYLRVGDGRARNIIREAREAGLLTATTPGRKGGSLTSEAVALLRGRDDEEQNR